MLRMPPLLALLVAAITITTTNASAQSAAPAGFGLGGTVGLLSVSDSINDINLGYGLEGNARYSFESGFQIVGGVTYGRVSVENVNTDREVLGFWIDPRLVLNQGRLGIAPYIGLRIAYMSWDFDGEVNGLQEKASADGWILGGAVGMYAPLARQLSLEAAVDFGFASFGDVELNGTTISNSSDTGATGQIKVGLVWTLAK